MIPVRPYSLLTSNPRFGFMTAPRILSFMDYGALGASTVGQNMGIYGGVIGSRLMQSRSPNERKENARRDILGWYNWFMGSPLIQTGLVLNFLPLASRTLLVTRMNQDAPALKKLMLGMFAPNKLWMIASKDQLEQHQNHVLSAMGNTASAEEKRKLANVFKTAIAHRGNVSLAGLAYTFFVLGVGIIWLNIFLTKRSLRKQAAKTPTPSPSAPKAHYVLPPVNLASTKKQAAEKPFSSPQVAKSNYFLAPVNRTPNYQAYYQPSTRFSN